MPRAARRRAESGIYHVMLRGCGRQCLFEDDADRMKFLEITAACTQEHGLGVLAWCLMDNHVHLILDDANNELSPCLKSLAGAYAMYFNGRTAHVGHVFQDRFRSKPIESEGYLMQAVRYVHENPQKAGLSSAQDYKWSSYHEYVGENGPQPRLASTDSVLSLLGGAEGFRQYHEGDKDRADDAYRFEARTRLNDQEALELALSLVGSDDLAKLKQMTRAQRAEPLRRLHDAGLSVRQLERVTGVGRWSIERSL